MTVAGACASIDLAVKLKGPMGFVLAAILIVIVGVGYTIFNPQFGGAIPFMVVGLLIVLLMYVAWAHNQRRAALLVRVAQGLGLEPFDADAAKLRALYGWDPVLGLNKGGVAKPSYRGVVRGVRVEVHQHQYTVHAGKATYAVVHMIGVMPAPAWWPRTLIINRGLKGLIEKWKNKSEVRVEHAKFNKLFDVHAEDTEFALAVLSEEMQTHLERLKSPASFEIRQGAIVWKTRTRLTPESIVPFVESGLRFAELIPAEVWGDQGAHEINEAADQRAS